MSEVELLFDVFQTAKGTSRIAALASLLAYLSHHDYKTGELCVLTDDIICKILQQIHASELPEWSLGTLLAGASLQFCTITIL